MSRRRTATAGGYGAALVVALLLPGALSRGDLIAATTSGVYAIAALGVVILTGWAGQSSLAQVSFMGVGAYTYARLVDAGTSPLLAAPIAVVVSAVISVVIGLPALRLRGVYLAVVTLAFAQVMENAAFNNDTLTNSSNGLGVPRPVFGPVDLTDDRAVYTAVLLLLVACCVAVALLRRTVVGRQLNALRCTEVGTSARGVDVVRAKLGAFAIAAALAGIGGIALGIEAGGINPGQFQPLESVFLLAVVVIAGQRSVAGALVAGALFGFLRVELARHVTTSTWGSNLPFLVTGFGLLIVVIGREVAPGVQETIRRGGSSLRRIGRPPARTREASGDAAA